MRSVTRQLGAVLALATALSSAASWAQTGSYPDHAIRLMVPWPAGGATDVLARIIAHQLGERVKQTVIVENKGGAGGNIGTTAFVKEKADGYSILMATSSTNAANPYLYVSTFTERDGICCFFDHVS